MSTRIGIENSSSVSKHNVLRNRKLDPDSTKMVPRVILPSHNQLGEECLVPAMEMNHCHTENTKKDPSATQHKSDPPLHTIQTNTVENRTAVSTCEADSMEELEDLDEHLMTRKPLIPETSAACSNSDNDSSMVKIESSKSILAQVFLPFLIAGFGTVGAGLVLDAVQVCYWS